MKLRIAFIIASVFCSLASQATTTGLTFVGGCPENATGLCPSQGSNATEEKVAAILGVNVANVTQIGELSADGSGSGFSITGIGDNAQTGNWSISDTNITHLAFKSNGYFILGKINSGTTSGTWDGNIGAWTPTASTVSCPATICGSVMPYMNSHFLNTGGEIANLSNVRAFSVVPIPGAVVLFGTALLGLFGIKRRRNSLAAA